MSWNDGATRHVILGLRHHRSRPGPLDQFTRATLRQPQEKLAECSVTWDTTAAIARMATMWVRLGEQTGLRLLDRGGLPANRRLTARSMDTCCRLPRVVLDGADNDFADVASVDQG
jgi:hypothetical protein